MKRAGLFLCVTLLAGLSSCGDPFTQPACYGGPGCGNDDIPPVATVASPLPGSTVKCPFTFEVTATDNLGVKGVDFFLMGFQMNGAMITKPPYRMEIDPTFVLPVPGACPGPRELTVLVHDVAENVDTVDFEVTYTPPSKPCPAAAPPGCV